MQDARYTMRIPDAGCKSRCKIDYEEVGVVG
jgi:hypothetical protein